MSEAENVGKRRVGRPKGSGILQPIADPVERERVWANSNHARLLRGDLKWRDLSDEEVNRGIGFNPAGNFAGIRQKYGPVPERLQNDRMVELGKRARKQIAEYAAISVGVVGGIMLDTDVKEADRLRAASMLQDRAWGKSPEVIAITDDSQNFGKLLDTVAGAQPDEEAYDPDISRINNSLTFGELGDEDIVDASWEEVGE